MEERISNDDDVQASFEMFVRGYDNGVWNEQDRILNLLRVRREQYATQSDFDGINKINEIISLIEREINE